jgi:hypothetical protein
MIGKELAPRKKKLLTAQLGNVEKVLGRYKIGDLSAR